MNDEITSIHKEINGRESSDKHEDEIRGIRRRKIRLVNVKAIVKIAEDTEKISSNINEPLKFF